MMKKTSLNSQAMMSRVFSNQAATVKRMRNPWKWTHSESTNNVQLLAHPLKGVRDQLKKWLDWKVIGQRQSYSPTCSRYSSSSQLSLWKPWWSSIQLMQLTSQWFVTSSFYSLLTQWSNAWGWASTSKKASMLHLFKDQLLAALLSRPSHLALRWSLCSCSRSLQIHNHSGLHY